VANVFGVQLEVEENLQTVISESQATTPIALASIPGHDAAFRVEALLAGSDELLPVAMGSAEGLRLAEQAIAEAARAGKTVLLKNVHLVSGWLSSNLEKRLQTLRPHPRFRLFLTMETSDKVRGPPPSALLPACKLTRQRAISPDSDLDPAHIARPDERAAARTQGDAPARAAEPHAQAALLGSRREAASCVLCCAEA
jgi:hypothetical protein